MKHLSMALVLITTLWGQGAMCQGFNKRYDAFGLGFTQTGWDIERSGDDFLVFSGSYEPDTVGPDSILGLYRIILEKIDSQGNLLSEKRHKATLHSLYPGWADCCDSIEGGGYVTAGTLESVNNTTQRTRLMRYDSNGDTLWTRDFGDSTQFWIGEQVKQTADGGFLQVGFKSGSGYYYAAFAIKTDSLGNEQWRHSYELGGVDYSYSDIVLLPDGYLLGGASDPLNGNSNFLVTKITGTGSEVWTLHLGSPYGEPNASIERLSDGRFMLFGGWASNANTWLAPYIAVLDPDDGQVTWSHQYGPPSYGRILFAGKEFPNTDIIACGMSFSGSSQQGLLLRTTATGDSLWMRTYAYHDSVIDQGEGKFWDVLPTPDGGCIAAGVAYNPFGAPYPPGYSQDTWVVKVDSMGCIVPGCDGLTGITEQVTNLGEGLTLYPNPVHEELHVGIKLPANLATNGPLTLTVTTLEGRLVLQEQVPTSVAGEMLLDVSSLAAGMYSLHLSDAQRWLAGKKFVVQ